MRGLFEAIEHIGSTAVPGLAAKPIIDLMASTPDLTTVVARDRELSGLGCRTANGMIERLFDLRTRNGRRTEQLHVVAASSGRRATSDYCATSLRTHADDVERYAALKRDLAARIEDPEVYTRAKTALIQDMVDRARADRCLPLIPVWEE